MRRDLSAHRPTRDSFTFNANLCTKGECACHPRKLFGSGLGFGSRAQACPQRGPLLQKRELQVTEALGSTPPTTSWATSRCVIKLVATIIATGIANIINSASYIATTIMLIVIVWHPADAAFTPRVRNNRDGLSGWEACPSQVPTNKNTSRD